jgi:hypothetical protein
LSRSYKIRIEYREDDTPKVFVESPDLTLLADGRSLPHVYREPDHLCLYLPGTHEWTPGDRIDLTIVPWVSLWLFYFEEWLESDEWKGGGSHPDSAEHPPRRAIRRMTRARSGGHFGAN